MKKSLEMWRNTAPRKRIPNHKIIQVEGVYCHIGKIVKEMRERLGITQSELARSLQWSRATIANIESGRQRVLLHELKRMADQLSIPTRDMLPKEFLL